MSDCRPGGGGAPPLRREEVAQLAAISPTYYALIERGRARNMSRQVVDALAAALRLSPPERDYLHTLAAGDTIAAVAPAEILAPGVADLVARLDPYPAYVTGLGWDVLAANRAARELWTDWSAVPEPDRNMLIWTFNAPQAREVFIEWESEAKALLGRFRTATARHLGDPRFTELIDRLHATSPEVRAWWDRHYIAPLGGGTKHLRHPDLGEIDLRPVVLQVADNPGHKFVTFTPTPHDTERIAALIARRRPDTTGDLQPSDPSACPTWPQARRPDHRGWLARLPAGFRWSGGRMRNSAGKSTTVRIPWPPCCPRPRAAPSWQTATSSNGPSPFAHRSG